jgi:cytidylate kinase
MNFVLTIDGPAAAGKSTTARAVAARLGLRYVDTGALYRAIALKVLDLGVPAVDGPEMMRVLESTHIELGGSPERPSVILDRVDVSERIRTPEVSEMSSRVAALPSVRRWLIEIQRGLRERGPLIAEGRDLGTVVFPDADLKIFLDADPATRAERRYQELKARGLAVTPDEVGRDVERRDERDRTRSRSPLKPAGDAVVIDTTGMTLEAQVAAVVRVALEHPRFAAR